MSAFRGNSLLDLTRSASVRDGGPNAVAQCRSCPVARAAEWEGVSDRAVAAFSAKRRTIKVKKQSDVYQQGDDCKGVYCLVSGLVALTMMDARGDVVCLQMIGNGGTFGYRSLLAREPHCVTATALTDCTFCHVEADAARGLLSAHPELLNLFAERTARTVRKSQEACLRYTTMNVRQKLLYFLLSLAGEQGIVAAGPELRIDLPVNRGDVADLIGVVPETMSRMTRRLESEGMLRFKGNRVFVRNADTAREEIADWETEGLAGYA